jgi:glycosyltransferase involved in cell wall biosynthesis
MLYEFRSGNGLADNLGVPRRENPDIPEEKDLTTQQKLRLCYISNPNIVHTRRWVNWFVKRGHSVCLLADVPLKEPWPEVAVIDLSKIFYVPIIRFPIWTVWIRRFLRQWQPDILHAHRVNSAGWLAAASGFHPYVVTPWGSDVMIQPQRSWVARFLARYTLRQADLITTISKAIGERAIQLGARSDTLRSVNFGVDLEIFTPMLISNQERIDLRRRLSLAENARLVLSPRAVHPIYNLDIILQAIPLVRRRFQEAYFIFTNYNTDPNYKRELDELIKELGLESFIRWLPPTNNRIEMAERYCLSDVVVSVPSSDGGTPVSVLEALACGKPVVCSDLPALREFITSGENGWLVPVRQTAALAEAINKLLGQPDQAAEFGRRAHQMVAEKANFEVEMQRMEAIYYQLAGSRRK